MQVNCFSIFVSCYSKAASKQDHASAMTAMETFMPGMRTGSFAPWRAGGSAGKPLEPFFVHSGEIRFLENDDGGAHDPIERRTCSFKDSADVPQALSGLLLDRLAAIFPVTGSNGPVPERKPDRRAYGWL
jgi:hypothetical protein